MSKKKFKTKKKAEVIRKADKSKEAEELKETEEFNETEASEEILTAEESKNKRIFWNAVKNISILQVLLLSFLTTIIIEILSKRSLFKMIVWMFKHPLLFLVNWMIVAVPYAIALAVRRRYAMYALAAFIWIVVGVIDCIVISCRVTPFTASDIKIVTTVFSVFTLYIKLWQLILIIAAILVVLGFVVFGFFKLPIIPKEGFHRMQNSLLTVVLCLSCIGFVSLSMRIGLIETNFVNLRNAYQDYGLAYCFTNSIFNTGVKKPKDYSSEKVDNIVKGLTTNEKTSPSPTVPGFGPLPKEEEAPNVIFVQLESFFNVNRLNGVTFKTDPIPNMTNLYENCYSGLLSVPSISAGTVNTEFEILTGMNMDDFGPGEYPYKTILTEKTTESMAYNLSSYGYRTHAIHNNTAGFYGRNIVYSNLGFNGFTSIEYMTDIDYNQLGWAKDKILLKYISKALNSTKGSDFVFTVSVQGHGAYPDDDVLKDESLLISLDGLNGEVGEYNFAYYLEQINEMDAFVGSLVEFLEGRQDKTVLVLYGDHLPGFDFTAADLNSGTLYDTEYAIWSNFDLGEPVKKDMQAYELSSYVMELLGYDTGVINRLHQNRSEYVEEDYLDSLQTLEYDMLYGDMRCWNGKNPYVKTNIAYGYDTIVVKGLQAIANPKDEGNYYLTVKGNFFNEWSCVYINDEKIDTIYVDEQNLFVPDVELKAGDSIVVSQYEATAGLLSSSPEYVVSSSDLERHGGRDNEEE